MNKNICIRLEKKEDYRETENLVRESFWNVYRPGCVEHYVLNKLRDDKDFVKELDFVMECGGVLIGQNVFVKAVIKADDGRDIPVMTMGPANIPERTLANIQIMPIMPCWVSLSMRILMMR